ncbi:MAG: hypothetical protein CL934_13605 [Deltaproteobacteria bacterium]|nr:hypothetical protein [Deltaproteobacteria bacterium]
MLKVWLKNVFGKVVSAGDTEILYDYTVPVLNEIYPADGVSPYSNTPVFNFTFEDLSLDTTIFEVMTGTHIIGYPGSTCTGNIQLSTDNFATCLPCRIHVVLGGETMIFRRTQLKKM